LIGIDVQTGGIAVLVVSQRLVEAGVDNPRLDSRLLVAHVLGITQTQLFSYPETSLNEFQMEKLQELTQRRASREPIARILGKREFWSLNFKVDNSTLVPRPDSETLVDAVLECIKNRKAPLSILDLGTGSGCLLLALLSELKLASGLGVDLSEQALKIATENAKYLNLDDRVQFQYSNWFENIHGREKYFNIIISNPPYISDEEIKRLEPEVSKFDPYEALSGGQDGLNAYKELMPKMIEFIACDGVIAVEIGMDQALDVIRYGEANGLQLDQILRDIAGHERVLIFKPRS
jgi:release factor glutamine methyltransferase